MVRFTMLPRPKAQLVTNPEQEETLRLFQEAEKNDVFHDGVWPGPEVASGTQNYVLVDAQKHMMHVVWAGHKMYYN